MPNTDAKLVLLDEDHSGRDEMNLAGNPFALLQAASKNGQKQIKREWDRRLPNGKIVRASWEVVGHTELGLPGPSEELLYLVLLQITREQREATGEWPQTVYFSRHNLFRRMGWGGNSRDYQALQTAFFRMRAVSIQAIYSFHDPRTGAPLPTRGFGLIEDFAFAEEKTGPKTKNADLPLSWFKWSDVLYTSFCSGNVRSLALDFTLSLDGAVSRRLFRLLELLRHARKPALDEVKLDLFDLRSRLGMAEYKYSSKIKEKLHPATDELTQRGYLDDITYTKEHGKEHVVFTFASPTSPSSAASPTSQTSSNPANPPKPAETPAKTPAKPTSEAATPSESPQSTPEPTTTAKTPAKSTKAKPAPTTTTLFPEETDAAAHSQSTQQFAARAHAVFQSLDAADQTALLEEARQSVSPIWHDRVGHPESPMSLGLWELVAARHGEKMK